MRPTARHSLLGALATALVLLAAAPAAHAQFPPGYPFDWSADDATRLFPYGAPGPANVLFLDDTSDVTNVLERAPLVPRGVHEIVGNLTGR